VQNGIVEKTRRSSGSEEYTVQGFTLDKQLIYSSNIYTEVQEMMYVQCVQDDECIHNDQRVNVKDIKYACGTCCAK